MIGIPSRYIIQRSEWTILSNPAVATRAVGSVVAAGAGISRVLDGLYCSLAAVAAQVFIQLVVRDGAAGVGPIIFEQTVKVVTADTGFVHISGLGLIGSANTAMAIEFLTAPAATNWQRIVGVGYNVNA